MSLRLFKGYLAKYLSSKNNTPVELKIRNSYLDSGNANEFLEAEFKPKINFPVIFSSISPSIESHIGNPEKFYFGGINLQYITEVQFNRNILLSTELNLPLYDPGFGCLPFLVSSIIFISFSLLKSS